MSGSAHRTLSHGVGGNGRAALGERGVALVAVLWITAALAILVSGMTLGARIDVRLAAQHLESARAGALLDGALRLAAAELVASPPRDVAPAYMGHEIGGVPIRTQIVRASGFISLNDAPESLLVDLFRYGADLPDEQAVSLAQRVIDWRDADDEPLPYGAEHDQYIAGGAVSLPRNEDFIRPSDISQVLGIEDGVHDKIADLITITKGGAGAVNPLVAPPGVLRILARGDASLVQRILEERAGGEGAHPDFSAIDARHVSEWFANDYRLTARIEAGSGSGWTRTAWLSLSANARPDAQNPLPWRWLYAESARRSSDPDDMNGDYP